MKKGVGIFKIATLVFAMLGLAVVEGGLGFEQAEKTCIVDPTRFVSKSKSEKEELNKRGMYEHIQDAIDADCTKVRIYQDIYRENLIIMEKSLTLQPVSEPGSVQIQGPLARETILILSSVKVTIQGLEITKGEGKSNFGILIEDSNEVKLIDNTISGYPHNGIKLVNSHAIIEGNEIKQNSMNGILLEDSQSVTQNNEVKRITIKRNEITKNDLDGVLLQGSQAEIIGNKISENNMNGILLASSQTVSSAIIKRNVIVRNAGCGIKVKPGSRIEDGSTGNKVWGKALNDDKFASRLCPDGAIPTDITIAEVKVQEDYDKIQQAINAVKEAAKQDSIIQDSVTTIDVFPQTNSEPYQENLVIDLSSIPGLVLKGNVQEKVVVQAADETKSVINVKSSALAGRSDRTVAIERFTIEKGFYGIEISPYTSNHITIENCTIRNNHNGGIFGNNEFSSINIEKSEILTSNTGIDAQLLAEAVVKNSRIEHNQVGIRGSKGVSISIIESTIGQSERGIQGGDSGTISIECSAVHRNTVAGIDVAGNVEIKCGDQDKRTRIFYNEVGISINRSPSEKPAILMVDNTNINWNKLGIDISAKLTNPTKYGTEICKSPLCITITNSGIFENSLEHMRRSGILSTKVTDSQISGKSWRGINIVPEAAPKKAKLIEIDKTEIFENQAEGIFIQDLAEVTITNSSVEKNDGTGISVACFNQDICPNVTVKGTSQPTESRISSNGLNGIHAAGGEVNITNLQISSNGRDGVRVDGGTVQVIESTISGNGVAADTDPQIPSNELNGIHIIGAATVTLDNNLITDNRGDGILLEAFPGCDDGPKEAKISYNKIFRNGIWGIAAWIKECHKAESADECTELPAGGIPFSPTNKVYDNGRGDFCPGELEKILKAPE